MSKDIDWTKAKPIGFKDATAAVKGFARIANKWTKAGLEEKLYAHSVAVAAAQLYRDHGNHDHFTGLAQAISKKWTKGAGAAFIDWTVKATGLSIAKKDNPINDLDVVFIHEKGVDRAAKYVSDMEKVGFFDLIQERTTPFDLTKRLDQTFSTLVKESGLDALDEEAILALVKERLNAAKAAAMAAVAKAKAKAAPAKAVNPA